MAAITVAECKRCGSVYHHDAETITIHGHEQLEIIKMRVAFCHYCPPSERTTINPNNIIPDYKGWDNDSWKQ